MKTLAKFLNIYLKIFLTSFNKSVIFIFSIFSCNLRTQIVLKTLRKSPLKSKCAYTEISNFMKQERLEKKYKLASV